MLRRLGLLGLIFICATFIGCSSNDSPTGSTGGGGGSTGRTVKANPSFASDIQEIFDRRGCSSSSCHGVAKQSNLDLRAGTAYSQIVNVAVFETSGTRVIPNDAQNSYLVMKIEGRQTAGAQMPYLAAPLDTIDIKNIRNWIDNGAPNN